MALGPVTGGFLVDSVGWRGIFWVNIPVGIAAIVLCALFVPESRAPRARRPDPLGQVLLIVLLASLTYAIIEGPDRGWGSPLIVGLFAVAIVGLAVFVWYEAHRDDPLLNPRFFRSAPFSGATATAVTSMAALGGFLFLNTLYLQDVRHYSPLTSGLYLLPMALMLAVCATLSGRIVANRGTRIPMVLSGIFIIAAGLLMTRLTATTAPAYLFLAYVIFGAGAGFVNAAITNSAVSGMPREQAGVAAGCASASRQIGQSLGVAVVGSVLNGNLKGGMSAGFVDASRPGWWIVAVCGAIGLILAIVTTGAWARRTAARTASLLSPADERSPVSVP
jgi:MFS family permease